MHRILILDDEESIRFSMSEYFKLYGYSVDCAESVEEAEALLGADPYLVLIADLRLSGQGKLNGMEVVRLVRTRHPSTLIIVLSAYRSPEIESEMLKYGVGVFLQKPKPLPDIAQIVFGMVGAGRPVLNTTRIMQNGARI